MKITKSQLKEIIREEIKNIREAKSIEVITYGGKTMKLTNDDIKEFLDDFDMYLGADNLPKWLLWSKRLETYKNKNKVKLTLQKILKHNGNVIINVRSDKQMENDIIFN